MHKGAMPRMSTRGLHVSQDQMYMDVLWLRRFRERFTAVPSCFSEPQTPCPKTLVEPPRIPQDPQETALQNPFPKLSRTPMNPTLSAPCEACITHCVLGRDVSGRARPMCPVSRGCVCCLCLSLCDVEA